MRESVRAIFLEFASRYTACVPWMYLDQQGMVRTGVGAKLEPIDRALALPWCDKNDGRKAEVNEISTDWVRVKKNRLLAHQGPNRARFVTQLELGKEGLEQATNAQLNEYEQQVQTMSLPHWAEFPANVQLALLSMVWTTGGVGSFLVGFPTLGTEPMVWAKFLEAMREGNWAQAGEHCFLDERNAPKLKPLNWAHRKLFTIAATTDLPEKVTGWP